MLFRRSLALVCLALLLPASAWARQIVGGTGAIVGTVSDSTGGVLPGVAVVVSGRPLIAPRRTITDAHGAYRVAALPPGDYELAFSRDGFTPLVRPARVGVSFTVSLDVALAVAARRDQLTVAARDGVLDRRAADVVSSFDARQLAELPTSRSMAGLLANAHAVSLTDVEVGGGSGVLAGAQSAYGRNTSPRHTIEGIIVTGLFGAGFTPDYGAIEAASVHAAAHGAEWPTIGIHTQLVTKSGGNSYRGTLYGAVENRRWQSVNVDDDQIARLAPQGDHLSPRHANRVWSYHDLNADIGGFVVRDRLWWYSSVRGQEVASQVVNFPAAPYRTSQQNYSGKLTYRLGPGTVVAYAQRGTNHQPYRLDPFGFAGSELSATTAINDSAESTANQRNATWLWKTEWNAVMNDALLFETRVGQFANDQRWTSRSTSPRFEDVETLVVSGGNRDWSARSRRNQLLAALTYFAGDHHLKFGGEAIRFLVRETWWSGYPGNVLHVLRSGRPAAVFLFETPSASESGVWTYSASATDSWQLHDRLTLTLGLRFDRYRLFLPAQEHAASGQAAELFAAVDELIAWNTVVPRIALVYALAGDGRTLVKASFGRYRSAPNASVGFNANPNSNVWWRLHDWVDADGSGVWEPGEEAVRRRRRGGTAIESLDPDLRLPVLHEAGVWIERELPGAVGVRVGGLWRREWSHFARQNVAQPFEAFTLPVTLRDPGPDGATGTADDGGTLQAYDLPFGAAGQTLNVVRNVPGSVSEYWTWEAAAGGRGSRWSFEAGFAHTWNRDQASGYSGQAVRNNPYPLTPNDLLNTGPGGHHAFTTWTAKANGTYETPFGVRVTPVVRHQSGQPFGRTFTTDSTQLGYTAPVTVLAERVGTRRMDHITLLDLRLHTRVALAGERRLGLFVDVFNALNANADTNTVWSSGPSFLRPLGIVSPRIARAGATLDW